MCKMCKVWDWGGTWGGVGCGKVCMCGKVCGGSVARRTRTVANRTCSNQRRVTLVNATRSGIAGTERYQQASAPREAYSVHVVGELFKRWRRFIRHVIHSEKRPLPPRGGVRAPSAANGIRCALQKEAAGVAP